MIQSWCRVTCPRAAGASLVTMGFRARGSERFAESHGRAFLRGMRDMDNVSETSALRIVKGAELKRLKGSRPKRGRGSGSADFNGRPAHASYPPVYRGILSLYCRCKLRNVVSRIRSVGRCKA